MAARFTWTLAPALLALAALPGTAAAQAQSAVCQRLEAQLAAIDRAGGDSSRTEQVRRFEENASRLQMEIDRTVAQSRRHGCESSGFFLFGRSQAPQCGELTNQIQRMRAQLDRVNMDLQRLQAGSSDQGEQRRAIMMSLSQYDCGPQYRSAAAAQRPRGFFESLFGPGAGPGSIIGGDPAGPDGSGTYRTVCVRTCDGYFFPISSSTTPNRFAEDERTCRRMCPATEAVLYSHRNSGESIREATAAATGQPYTALPAAFKYRTEFNAACSCRQPGQSWAEAIGPDSTVERGDIVVTEQTSRQMSQPRPEPGRPAAKGARGTTAAVAEPTPAPTTTGATPDATDQPQQAEAGQKRATRSVGPRFLPVR